MWNLTIVNQDDEIVYQVKKGKKLFIKQGTKQDDTQKKEQESNTDTQNKEKVDSEPKNDVKEPNATAVDYILKKNKEIYMELLTLSFNLLVSANYPESDSKSKEFVKNYFEKTLKIAPIKTLNDKVELTRDTTQEQPTIPGRILLQKDDLWFGHNKQASLKYEIEQEINIYEMENAING